MTDSFLAKNNLDRANNCELQLIREGPIQEPLSRRSGVCPTLEIQSHCWCRTWLVSADPSNLTAANGNLSGALQETEGKEKGGQNLWQNLSPPSLCARVTCPTCQCCNTSQYFTPTREKLRHDPLLRCMNAWWREVREMEFYIPCLWDMTWGVV